MDSPPRVLRSLDLDEAEIATVELGARTNDPGLVDPLVTHELLRRYQIAGSAEECASEVARMAVAHDLRTVLIDALSTNFDDNVAVLKNSLPIIQGTL